MKFPNKFTRNLKNLAPLLIVQLMTFFVALESYAQSQPATSNPSTPSTQQPTKDAAGKNTVESDKPAAVLPAVTVEGKATEEVTGYVAKRSSTATKTDTPILEIPQSVSVIPRRELDMRSVQNFTEALRYAPGVAVDQFGFEGRGFEYLQMRGFNVGVTGNFRDNLSNSAQGLFFGGFITDPYALERVDVLRGPTSVMFGRGDAGGIVNRIYKKPSATPIREIEFQYGNFDRKRIAADLGWVSKDEKLMFRLVTLGLDSDTQVKYPNTGGDRAGNERFYIAPSVTWRPTIDTTITLMGDFMQNRSGASAFYLSSPQDTFTNRLAQDPKFTRYNADQSAYSHQIEHHFNEIFTVRQNFRYAQQDGRFNDLYRLGYNFPDQPTLQERLVFATRERVSQTVLDTHLQAKINTGPIHHTALLGVDWNTTNAAMKLFEGNAAGIPTPGLDIANPVYPQDMPAADNLSMHSKQKIDQLGFYLQDQLRYQNWVLTLGGRYDRVATKDKDLLFPDDPEFNAGVKRTAFTGRAGLNYVFSNGIAPYVSYSQSFLPQAGFDRNFNSFDPTRAAQYEVGIKYQPVGTNNLYTMALFDLTKTNVLVRDPDDPQGFRSKQVGEIGSRGAELEARTEILPGLHLVGNFTYQDVKVTKTTEEDTNGKMPVQIPNTITSAWLDYSVGHYGVNLLQRLGVDNVEWLRGLGIGGGVRYLGRVFDDGQNTSTTPAFTLFDATLRYDYGPWLFTISAHNIFNNQYISAHTVGNFYLGTQRTIVGTLKFRF